ncbi:acetyl-CoA carboxylase family protein [Pseudomonas mangrovi]|uniref:Carbamoyl-phosphate synthase large subunit n=1 Tax=Pseudomonas mangrovi TaxID=2161748 RepID=A0A2T5P8R3_9PSED|nr:carboxyl transferase domain-containing protein [Pseudomonas mangrovi]PTU74130.1 carbamoyl-phosphate synthase large subunit [Pseudomonas mangrovi]
MPIRSLLIANRGEIAIRIARACAELDIRSVAVHAEDDVNSLHVRKADALVALRGRGVAAYLDMDQLVEAARAQGCDAIHPGYGFLAENAEFARRCQAAGIVFVGPEPEVLESFGDKTRARALALELGVPLAAGSNQPTTLEQARTFLAEQGAIMLKALAGGGGRGMRAVRSEAELADAYARCTSEASAAFGKGDLYVERLIEQARHIEVQVIGDGQGNVSHLWERDCTLQRRNQKLVEIAPAPTLSAELREQILAAALKLASAVNYRGLGTFEFLLDEQRGDFVFMEANPRVQVEHTVTEAVTGIDLVQAQIRVAGGASLTELNLLQAQMPAPRGFAVQLRINLERMAADGSTQPAAGIISAYEPPSGPGIRVDGYGYAGYATSSAYDSLLAKLIVHADSDFPGVLRRAYRALCEFRLEGVASNLHLLQNLLRLPQLASNAVSTRFVEQQIEALLAPQQQAHPHLYFAQAAGSAVQQRQQADAPAGCIALNVPNAGVLVSLEVAAGDAVAVGQTVAILEAMKMEFEVKARESGIVRVLVATPGDNLYEGGALVYLEPMAVEGQAIEEQGITDLDHIRADLAEVIERHAIGLDERRPQAVAKRHKIGMRTIRENLGDLLDDGSFIEYGALALAAQRRRHSHDELLQLSPADGMVAGLGTVNAGEVGEQAARCMVVGYDYTVFAGTQGVMNHKKTERMLHLAEQWQVPLVLLAEGGGGRPNDTDFLGVAGLDNQTFIGMARLSGLVPLVGLVAGRCFAGNAALLGCCDVIIATQNSSIGMAGPAMIEGGGLGKFSAEEVGPASVQGPNGVIDVLVEDEAEAVAVAKRYIGYFQGETRDWQCADQRLLRQLIPENRLRVYDIRQVIETLADTGSVLELRRQFAPGMITALVRIQGKPFGLIANNPQHLGGAIDSEAGDKSARFMQLCDAFDIPMISLCDTPGFMVGPDAEKTATVRHVSRMFVTAASLSVPFFTVVLRKGYGLGAQAMAAGGFHSAFFTVAWPSGEFGAMGLEGAVRLGFAKELAAIEDPHRRERLFKKLVDRAYRHGKGINMASFLEIDDVIDPEQTRHWLLRGLASTPKPAPRQGRKRPFVDTW